MYWPGITVLGVTAPEINRALGTKMRLAVSKVPEIQVITNVTFSSTANATTTIAHSLGRVPIAYIWVPKAATSVYADDNDRNTWDAKSISLKCNTASATGDLIVIAL